MQNIDCIITLEDSENGQPVWIENQQSLFWVDYANQCLYQYCDTSQELSECKLDAPILSISPRINNGFIATLEDGIGFFDMQSRKVTYISKPEPFAINKKTIAGVTDSAGNYWSFVLRDKTTSGEQPNLYQLNAQQGMKKVLGDQWYCTAPPAFSTNGKTLFQSSGPTRYIYATTLDENHKPVNTYSFCRISKSEGYPHGLCIDSEDHLWVCHRGAGYISRFNPAGERVERIKLDAPGAEYCTFGGENMNKLFVVTTSIKEKAGRKKLRYANSILSLQLNITGMQINQFTG